MRPFALTGWVWVAVNALAVYRLTLLATQDFIADRPRNWVKRRGTFWADLVGCAWCVSVWVAAAVVALARLAAPEWQYPALLLAFSAVAGFLAERS